MSMTAAERSRFAAKFQPVAYDRCWKWGASKRRDGYGQFLLAGIMIGAHRAAWIYAHGEIPCGLHVLHRCDNRSCVNPTHLFLGTHADNMRDMCKKGRHRALRGERQRSAVLTEGAVRNIRVAMASGASQRSIARFLRLNSTTVNAIARGRTWGHVS
jgi:hypothetical protein